MSSHEMENQELHYREMITANPMYEFAGIYSDQGISGYREARPGFQKMMEDARAGKIDLIITKSISRFARNTVTVLKSVRELKGMGVGIFFELQGINTLSGEGELMLTILSAFAQAASVNAKLTNLLKFKQGIPAVRVGKCYGFSQDSNGDIILDAEQAFVVRKIYQLAADGVWGGADNGIPQQPRLQDSIGSGQASQSGRRNTPTPTHGQRPRSATY